MTLLHIAPRILHDLNASSALLLVIASCLLWCKPGRGRIQIGLAVITSLWSLPYIAGVAASVFDFHIAPMGGVLPVPYMVGGTFYMILLLLLPYDMVCPGRVTVRRTILLMLPLAMVGGIYYAVTFMLGEGIGAVASYGELFARMAEFSIWFRLVLFVTTVAYAVIGWRCIVRELPNYVKRCDEEFGAGPEGGLIWIRIYAASFGVMLISYSLIILVGHTWTEILHTVILQIFFVFIFFKSWNYVTPYSECEMKTQQRSQTHIQDSGDKSGCCGYCAESGATAESEEEVPAHSDEEQQFDDKIAEYSHQVREWFESERPYLNPDFKLIDVMAVLPLNRTYLSRVFNEGFGENFSAVVRGYRLRYAEQLLTDSPSMSIVEVARRSGFSSNSVFHRAFLAYKGVTPVKFRKH